MASEHFLINPMLRKRGRSRLSLNRKRFRHNPFGAELAILGGNPKHKEGGHEMEWNKKKKSKKAKALAAKKRRAKRAALKAEDGSKKKSKKEAKKSKKGVKKFLKRGKHKVRGTLRINPAMAGVLGIDFGKIMPVVISGSLAIVATKVVPGLLGVTSTPMKYGIKTATAIGGGILINKFVGKEHGLAWTVTGLAVVVADALSEFVLPKILGRPSVAELGAFVPQDELGAFVPQDENLSDDLTEEEDYEVQAFGY